MRRALVVALVALVAAGALLGRAATKPVPEREDAPDSESSVRPPEEIASLASAEDARVAAAPPRPRSLRGTRVDGGLVVDHTGRPVGRLA